MKIHKSTGGGPKFEPDELNGALLLCFPSGLKTVFSKEYGEAEGTVTDVHILSGGRAGEVLLAVLIFQKLLQSDLRPLVGSGDPVLGRLGKGVASKGKSAPWIFEPPTDDDLAIAQKYVATLDNAPIGKGQLESPDDEEPDLDGPGF
jgi:hypothetical protein